MNQYDRALKIASIKAEKSLGYQKLDNASKAKKYMLDTKSSFKYPTFEEMKFMAEQSIHDSKKKRHKSVENIHKKQL